jgi:hypothetical protein
MQKYSPKELAAISRKIETLIDQMVSLGVAECDESLHTRSRLFSESSTLREVQINDDRGRGLTAVVDVSRCDVEALVNKMVAVRTACGLEVRWLDSQDDVYLLLPFLPHQTTRVLRAEGEWSVAGLVRWIGNEAAPVALRRDESQCARTISIRSGARKAPPAAQRTEIAQRHPLPSPCAETLPAS